MGGLRRFMPVTWILMWAATLAISGVPVFSGFVSKDEILGGVFARSHDSTLADASLLGIPGSAIMIACYVMGLAAALMTAIYMTRMMLYTFHGPNRTGEPERGHLREAPWIMTGPLVILGVLSVFGGWFNLPSFLGIIGPTHVLEHWLEPVVGAGALRITKGVVPELHGSTEVFLVGAAVAIALVGIAIAVVRLKPERLVPKAQSPEEHGFERVLANKYYVDEAYDAAIVNPVVATSRGLLWRGVDVGVIDGLTRLLVQSKDDDAAPGTTVPMGGLATRAVGWIGSQLQSGQVGTYAWVLVVGVLFVLGAFTFR
jgi:NADH-quinone oxidoreductase subunit L